MFTRAVLVGITAIGERPEKGQLPMTHSTGHSVESFGPCYVYMMLLLMPGNFIIYAYFIFGHFLLCSTGDIGPVFRYLKVRSP